MVQVSIEDTPYLFTIRLTTFDALVQVIVRHIGSTKILPLSWFDKANNIFVRLDGENIEPLRRKTHIKIRLGSSETVPYEGELNNEGKKHGQGMYRWPNGRTYIGEWYDNQMDGDGVETWPNGSKYQGQLKANKRHGQGAFTWADGRQYIGRIKNIRLSLV
jgi:hypothetical protein